MYVCFTYIVYICQYVLTCPSCHLFAASHMWMTILRHLPWSLSSPRCHDGKMTLRCRICLLVFPDFQALKQNISLEKAWIQYPMIEARYMVHLNYMYDLSILIENMCKQKSSKIIGIWNKKHTTWWRPSTQFSVWKNPIRSTIPKLWASNGS